MYSCYIVSSFKGSTIITRTAWNHYIRKPYLYKIQIYLKIQMVHNLFIFHGTSYFYTTDAITPHLSAYILSAESKVILHTIIFLLECSICVIEAAES